jgi:hypothetical protein
VRAEAGKCLDHFMAEFTAHRGALPLGDPEEDIEVLSDVLFRGYTPADVASYTTALMNIIPAHPRARHCQCDRCWIANSDKSVRVLRWCLVQRKRLKQVLDLELRRVTCGGEGRVTVDSGSLCPHSPSCSSITSCRARIFAREA